MVKYEVGDEVIVGPGFHTLKEGTRARVEEVDPWWGDKPYLIVPDKGQGSAIRVRADQVSRAETRWDREVL